MNSELFVQKLFQRNYGVHLSKIKESGDKSPDYEFIFNGKRVFVCELKTIERVRTEAAGWEIINDSEGMREATRDDNAVERVARKIHEAHKQLKSYSQPKVLIFLNKDSLVDFKDLEEAFNGYQIYSNGRVKLVNTASARIANGIIRNEKYDIDLYVWVDKPGNEVFFRYLTQIGCDLAHKFFKH